MPAVVYMVRDLLFTSKIRETAKQLGLDAQSVRSVDELTAQAKDARVVILDLRLPEAIAALQSLTGTAVAKLGFVDHERADLMAEATRLGCTQVLAKGKFSSDLPRILAELPA